MTQTPRQYGLLIARRNFYGTEYIDVRIVNREGDSVRGCGGDGCSSYNNDPKHLWGMQLDGLGLYGFVSEYNNSDFIGCEPEFRDVYALDLRKVEGMRKTLKRIVGQQQRDRAFEHGDRLVSLAKALKLTFVCHKISPDPVAWDESRWDFMSIEAGRNYFRHVVEEVRAEVTAKKGGRVA